MKVLFKSFCLYFLGIWADSHKKAFDRAVDRCIAKGGDISSKRLTRMSDRSYRLYMQFMALESDITRELTVKTI